MEYIRSKVVYYQQSYEQAKASNPSVLSLRVCCLVLWIPEYLASSAITMARAPERIHWTSEK